MSLETGTRLGSYEIVGTIGAGGMGEVYRATDTKLGREVAIKTLPASLAGDADRLARFEREAKLLAALNHAHIGTVHSLDEQDGTLYIAMELVDGETLEEKLRAGALPVEDALQYALQIASALEAAHEKGVVHRDLKPANIMVTSGGAVKVLDFGLAKAFAGDPAEGTAAQSPALSVAMTQAGLVLGTAGYMSPEQASGQATDQRADVWSFGVVLYEMLTGQPLFSGESVPHILADVLKTEPDWHRLPKGLDPRLVRLLERCLTKKPRNRLHAIADARIEIEQVLSKSNVPDRATAASGAAATVSGTRRIVELIGIAVAAALVAAVGVWLTLKPSPEPINRFAYPVPAVTPFRNTGRAVLAVSPDGRHFAYNTTGGIFIRPMDELQARLVAGTEGTLTNPIFSPDGQSLAYAAGNELKRIAIAGGASVTVTRDIENPWGMSWGADGTILFGQTDGIYRVPATGGRAERVIPVDSSEESVHGPSLLPDGEHVLFSVGAIGDWDNADIVVQSLVSGDRTVLVEGGSEPRYLPTGHIVYTYEDTLYGIAFDADALTVSGGSVPLAQGILRSANGATGAANFDVTSDGTLIYLTGASLAVERTLAWVDRSGREEPIAIDSGPYVYAQLSPDGRRIALDARDAENDIWVFDLERETLQRLTIEPDLSRSPVWTPDGKRIAFALGAGTTVLQWQASDGSSVAEPLLDDPSMGEQMYPSDFTPDGRSLIYTVFTTIGDIGILPIDAPDDRSLLIATPADERNGTVSPDGRWIAFQSDQSGRFEIYVRPFPEVDRAFWQVSRAGGTRPEWSRDGSELFFLDAGVGPIDAVMSVPIRPGETFDPGEPVKLFSGDYLAPNLLRGVYDVTADGQRFLMIKRAAEAADAESTGPEIVIVQNWFQELDELVPTD